VDDDAGVAPKSMLTTTTATAGGGDGIEGYWRRRIAVL